MPMLCLHPGVQTEIHSETRASGHDYVMLTKRTHTFKIWNTSDHRSFLRYALDVKVVLVCKKIGIGAFMKSQGISE